MKSFSWLAIVGAVLLAIFTIFSLRAARPTSAHPPLDATPVSSDLKNPRTLRDPCEKQPNNLLKNGTMGPEHRDTPYGTVASEWLPFIFSGAPPQFRVVSNEGIDGVSQQVFSSETFDAGIYQTVHGTQPGVHYWVRWGFSLAARGIENSRVDSIGRKIGADPFGGTDSRSANVLWGPDMFDGRAATNLLEMILLFPARAERVTIFLRGIARDGSSAENGIWIDSLCMEARSDLPNAAPLPPPSPTVQLVPTARATFTRIPPTRTPAPSPTLTQNATSGFATELAALPEVTATRAVIQPIRARPSVASTSWFDLDSQTLVNIGYAAAGSALFFFLVGLALARRAWG